MFYWTTVKNVWFDCLLRKYFKGSLGIEYLKLQIETKIYKRKRKYCQKSSRQNQIVWPTVSEIFKQRYWKIDLIYMIAVPVEYGGQKYEYILSIIGMFWTYLICRPLQNKNSCQYPQYWKKNLFFEYGIPQVIKCDNGTEFKGYFDSLI